MSELKMSCPKCGQHIAYDQAWAGQATTCPTCQGPIIIPSSAGAGAPPPPPRPGPRPAPASSAPPGAAAPARGRNSGLAIASMVSSLLLCLAPLSSIAGVICGHLARRELRRDPSLRGKGMALTGLIAGYASLGLTAAYVILFLFYFSRSTQSLGPNWGALTNPAPVVKTTPARSPSSTTTSTNRRASRPAVLPANSADSTPQPANPAVGKVGNREFKCESASLQNGWLKLRQGKEFFADAEIKVVLFKENEELPGQTFSVGPGSRGQTPHLHLSWKEGNALRSAAAVNNYTLTLQFEALEGSTLRGHIDLAMPGTNGVTVKGDFIADLK